MPSPTLPLLPDRRYAVDLRFIHQRNAPKTPQDLNLNKSVVSRRSFRYERL